MYQYDQVDQTIVDERVVEYRDQVSRRVTGALFVLASFAASFL